MIIVQAAAIKWHDGRVFSVERPGRHSDVIDHMICRHGIQPPINRTQGFILSDGSFATRAEARLIAEEAGQLLTRACDGQWLYSEDVW